jgi:hypothetical protein
MVQLQMAAQCPRSQNPSPHSLSLVQSRCGPKSGIVCSDDIQICIPDCRGTGGNGLFLLTTALSFRRRGRRRR